MTKRTETENGFWSGVSASTSLVNDLSFIAGDHHTYRMEDETAEAKAAREAAEVAARKKIADDAAAAAAAEEERKRKERESRMSPTERELLHEVMASKDEKKKLADQLKAAQDQLDGLSTQLKVYEGIDPAKVNDLLKAHQTAEETRKKAEEEALKKNGEWDRLRERMATEHQTEVKTLKDQLAELSGAVSSSQSTINELTVGSAFANSEFIRKELVMPPQKARVVYGDHFELENGRIVAFDKPKGAKDRTKLVDSSGLPVPFDVAVKKLVDADPDKDHLLRSNLRIGAASRTDNGGSGGRREDGGEIPLTGRARIAAALQAAKKS